MEMNSSEIPFFIFLYSYNNKGNDWAAQHSTSYKLVVSFLLWDCKVKCRLLKLLDSTWAL